MLRSPPTPPVGRLVRPPKTLIFVMLPRKWLIAAQEVTPPIASSAAREPATQASTRLRLRRRGSLGVASRRGCGPRGLSSAGSAGPSPGGPSPDAVMDAGPSRVKPPLGAVTG